MNNKYLPLLVIAAALIAGYVSEHGIPNFSPTPMTGKIRVLIVEETQDRGRLQRDQIAILTGGEVRDYLKSHGIEGDAVRILDKDQDPATFPEVWQDGWKIPRHKVPWVVVSNGKNGASKSLPKNVEEFLGLLQKYGGP